METFSDRLNKAMKLRKINATKLSELTGIDQGSISYYRSGKYKAKQDKLYDLARALRVSPAWLMGQDVPMEDERILIMEKQLEAKLRAIRPDSEQKILDAYRTADKRTQKAVRILLGIEDEDG